MVKRCMESRTPFGVINISAGQLATIGTIADIREATRYVDGRWDLVTLGTTRFRVIRLDRDAPYLRAEIALLDEPEGGPPTDLLNAAERVSAGFVGYLELLRGADEHDHGGDDADEDGDDDEEEGEELLSDEVTVEAIDEALAEEEGLRLSQEVVIEIERLMLASSAASASISGGTIIPGAGRELVIFSSGNTFTVNSVLANSASGASDVTYRGNEGLGIGKNNVIIDKLANNTYTGNTYISGVRVYLGTATTTNSAASTDA